MAIKVTLEPDIKEIEILENGLNSYNEKCIGELKRAPLACFEKDAQGNVIAGVAGICMGQSLFIKQVWVEECLRRNSLGTKLLLTIEEKAKLLNIKRVFLNTYSFQAEEYYQANGYKEVAIINNCPSSDISRIYYCKELV